MAFNDFLTPILQPVFDLGLITGILIVSFVVSLVITIVYKLITDQEMMKSLKEEMKASQKEMKKFKDNPSKMMKLQKQTMEKNMKYMMASLKPTFVTLLPILLIFTWMAAHLGYDPILPGQQFEVTTYFQEGVVGTGSIEVPPGIQLLNSQEQDVLAQKITWVMSGDTGDYNLLINFNSKQYEQRVVIDDYEYSEPKQKVKDSHIETIETSNQKTKGLNLFGWQLGWLGTYIIFSIVFSIALRKILKVY